MQDQQNQLKLAAKTAQPDPEAQYASTKKGKKGAKGKPGKGKGKKGKGVENLNTTRPQGSDKP